MKRLITQHPQSGRPQSGYARLLPARHFSPEIGVPRSEIWGTMVALPVIRAAGAHAARRTTALVEYARFEARLLQDHGAGQASDAGTDYGNMRLGIHKSCDAKFAMEHLLDCAWVSIESPPALQPPADVSECAPR